MNSGMANHCGMSRNITIGGTTVSVSNVPVVVPVRDDEPITFVVEIPESAPANCGTIAVTNDAAANHAAVC